MRSIGSAKRLAPHLAEFFPSTVGLSLEIVAVKQFRKELGTENHNSNQRNNNVCIYSFVTFMDSNTSYVRPQR